MLRKAGSIPQNLTYILQQEEQYNCGSWHDEKSKMKARRIIVTDNPKALISGGANAVQVLNNKITNAKIINNFYILLDEKYVTPISQNLISDLVVNGRVNKGKINDTLVWCKIGGNFELVRYKSGLYTQVIESQIRKNKSKIKKKDFQVGGIYSTPSGKREIFLGNINTYEALIEYKSNKTIVVPVKNKMLCYNVTYNGENIINNFTPKNINKWALGVKQTHSFVEKCGQVDLDSDIIDQIRVDMIKRFKEFLVQHSKQKGSHYPIWEYRSNCPFLSMSKVGDPVYPQFDMDKYLLLS